MGKTSFRHQRRLPTTHAHRGTQEHTATHSGVNTCIPRYASTNLVAPVWSRASQNMPSYTPVLQGNNALEERRAHTRRSIPPTARSATVRATQRRISCLRALTARRELIFLCFECCKSLDSAKYIEKSTDSDQPHTAPGVCLM